MQFDSNCWHSVRKILSQLKMLLLFLFGFLVLFFTFLQKWLSHTCTWFYCNGLSEFTVFLFFFRFLLSFLKFFSRYLCFEKRFVTEIKKQNQLSNTRLLAGVIFSDLVEMFIFMNGFYLKWFKFFFFCWINFSIILYFQKCYNSLSNESFSVLSIRWIYANWQIQEKKNCENSTEGNNER